MIIRTDTEDFIDLSRFCYFRILSGVNETSESHVFLRGYSEGGGRTEITISHERPAQWRDAMADYIGKCLANGKDYVDMVDICQTLPPESLFRLAERSSI